MGFSCFATPSHSISYSDLQASHLGLIIRTSHNDKSDVHNICNLSRFFLSVPEVRNHAQYYSWFSVVFSAKLCLGRVEGEGLAKLCFHLFRAGSDFRIEHVNLGNPRGEKDKPG